MSTSEDYLDQLLSGMTSDEKKQQDSVSDEDFLQEIDGSLGGGMEGNSDTDGFLKDFEKELETSDDDFLFSDGPDPFAGDGAPISFQNLDELISLSKEEADDSIENMKPTSSHASGENFDLGLSDAEKEIDPSEVPEDILNLMESVEEAGGESKDDASGDAAGEDDSEEKPIASYEVGGEIDRSELDNPEHVRKTEATDEAEGADAAEDAGGLSELGLEIETPEEAAEEPGEAGAEPSGEEAAGADAEISLEDGEAEPVDPAAVAEMAAAESGIQDEAALEQSMDTESAEDLLDLLNGLEEGGAELADIGDLLNKDSAGIQELSQEEIENLQDELRESRPEGEDAEEEEGGKKKRGKKKKKEKKGPGFLQKLAALLFSEPDPVDDATIAAAAAGGAETITDENLAILKELDAAGEGDNGAVGPGDKKKKKKEKKEKKPKKEKPKKEPKPKKEKKPKPKKEKKPKEVDTSPKLPKKPVIVIVVFALSIAVLIIVCVKTFGKAGSIPDARKAYETGDYIACYRELSGMELTEADLELYQKSLILSAIQKPYQDFAVLYNMGEYEMALDSLIRSIGRCYNYEEQANELQLTDTIVALRDQSANDLNAVFGLTLDDAVAIYGIRDRDDYTVALKGVLRQLGLETKEE